MVTSLLFLMVMGAAEQRSRGHPTRESYGVVTKSEGHKVWTDVSKVKDLIEINLGQKPVKTGVG